MYIVRYCEFGVKSPCHVPILHDAWCCVDTTWHFARFGHEMASHGQKAHGAHGAPGFFVGWSLFCSCCNYTRFGHFWSTVFTGQTPACTAQNLLKMPECNPKRYVPMLSYQAPVCLQ